MSRRGTRRLSLTAGCLALVCVTAQAAVPAREAVLTEAPRLAGIYDAILAADFARADELLRDSCPPAPAEACATLAAVSLWWQINLHPESRLLDQRFNDAAAHAIKTSEAWTKNG